MTPSLDRPTAKAAHALRRRDFLRGGVLLAASLAVARVSPGRDTSDGWERLLPDYLYSARANLVMVNGRQAMLSSHLYPQGTYLRDAFYGTWALGDLTIGQQAYAWFVDSQLASGQIRTAVAFDPRTAELVPQDDDSALLFIVWSAALARRGGAPALDAVARAWAWARARVIDGWYVSPAGPFRYWADTVMPEVPERLAHNQGLYVAALLALGELGVPCGGAHALALAAARYRSFYDAGASYLTLGRDSRWAPCQDVSAVFGEFLCRALFERPVLPDSMVTATVGRQIRQAGVYFPFGKLAGVKVICARDGAFLPSWQFFSPALNTPGAYHNGGYWPLYTLVALALDYAAQPDAARRARIGELVALELGQDHVSKEVMLLSPGREGQSDPARSGYTWNALIPTALEWAGVVAGAGSGD